MATRHKPATASRIYAWFSAVVCNDVALLQDLLVHGVPVDVPHPLRHSTALMEATRLGRADLVQWLLERGAAPAFSGGYPTKTALHCALRRRHWDIAQILANAMSSCAVLDGQGASPLHILCTEAFNKEDATVTINLALLLILKGCPLDTLDHEGTTALHHCVVNELPELAHMLLSHGATPNALIPGSQVSPLMIAALEKNIEMARLLIAHGANPNLTTHDGSSPLSVFPTIAELVANDSAPPAIPLRSREGVIG